MPSAFHSFLLAGALTAALSTCPAADWPMWRCDAARTAATDEKLPSDLHVEWERSYPARRQAWDDPLNHDLMTYDRIFEPVVADGRMFVGFNDRDKVVALDLASGAEIWSVHVGGPVRLPPAVWNGKVYFTSDDGFLHCVSADDGRNLWSVRGGPSARKALGNGRLISAWPARGGPVIRDGCAYFAASIWPFMGTFIYALDAETGETRWVNDGTGAQFIKQPHSAPSFAGVAPQGALVATENLLIVPGGRSVPAAFDRATGDLRYFNLNEGGKGNGGSFVAAGKSTFYVHTRLRGVRSHDLKTGKPLRFTCGEPVITDGEIYSAAAGEDGEPLVRAFGADEMPRWEIKVDASGDLIKAGDFLYAAGKDHLTAIAIPQAGSQPRVAWSQSVNGEIQRLLAARGKLIGVTLDGRILVFGEGRQSLPVRTEADASLHPSASALATADRLLKKCGSSIGHVLCFDAGQIDLIDALLVSSTVEVAVVDPDSAKVENLRRRFDATGHYGTRCTAHQGDPATFMAPPFVAQLVIAPPKLTPSILRTIYPSVRPYGGVFHAPRLTGAELSGFSAEAGLEQAVVRRLDDEHTVIAREGALPGSADWTHQYGDIGNTVKSDDRLVKAPLGILWFGGTSNLDVLPRHGHGPPEQVIGGRLIIEGMNSFSARDVYTGQLLWKTSFDDLGTFGIYYNETYADTPLSTTYNQKHIPGANGRGTNFVATADTVYVAVRDSCQLLDTRTGTLGKKIPLRENPGDADWGFIGVYEDILLGGDGFARYSLKLGGSSEGRSFPTEDYSASDGIAAFDRHSGKLLWRMKARHSLLHNGIVAGNGRIYCLDKLAAAAEGLLQRRGIDIPSDYRIVALDARTGAVLWEQGENVFGTWLGYSRQHDILLQAGAKAKDRLAGEVGDGMIAYRGSTGQIKWQNLDGTYTGPCILHNAIILTGANAYESSSGAVNLEDGTPHLVRNPLTGKMEPWRVNRAYGCNTMIASEHLLTFRSGAAGFYDLDSMSGTGNLGGFKSGCTSNLIAADGVLNAPDYTRTCSCAYQNQTSLALVHMPEMDLWTYSQFGLDGTEGERIHRVGINFGAPGDRRAPDGTLWLDYPDTGAGMSPGLGVKVTGTGANYFRRHSSAISEGGLPWVGASGLVNADRIVITPNLVRPVMKKPSSKGKDEDGDTSPGKASAERGSSRKSARPVANKETAPAVSHPHATAPYTIRLHFAEISAVGEGERVFSVTLQDNPALENFDIVKSAGGSGRMIVREFPHIPIKDDLVIQLRSASGSTLGPLICGVELIAEPVAAGESQE